MLGYVRIMLRLFFPHFRWIFLEHTTMLKNLQLLLLKKIKYLLDVQKLTLDGVNDYLSKSKLKMKSLDDNILSDLKDLLGLLKKSR